MVSPSAVELDGEFNHRMLHTRGVRLHVADAASAFHGGFHPDADNRPLILLIHGALGSWCDFKDVIAPLAGRGYHVAALDLRGYGMSDKPAARAGDLLHILSGDVAGVVSTLGHTRATVVGSDTGAVIAQAAAKRHPGHIERVIALPTSRSFASAATRANSRMLRSNRRMLDRIWRASLEADTSPAFHGTTRFEEFLALRITARDIDHALPHITATSRLRPRRPLEHDVPELAFSHVPHIEDPQRFVDALAHALR